MRAILSRCYPYLLAGLMSAVILWSLLDLQRVDFRVPFLYHGDALFYAMVIKATGDNGWYLRNPYLGMPFGMDLHDFPFSDSLHILIMKLFLWMTGEWGRAMNYYYILTYPLATVTSMLVLRHFGVSRVTAAVMGLLFAFLPYHFHRGEGHLFLSAYYLVPFMVMLAVWVYCDEHFLRIGGNPLRNHPTIFVNRKWAAAVIICLLTGSAGVYYAFFGCFFLLVAGTASSFAKRTVRPLIVSVVLVLLVSCSVGFNLSGNFFYSYKHGTNAQAAGRQPLESEIYGLKIIQLLLPTTYHRVAQVARLKDMYNQSAPIVNENQSVSLGLIGSIGFLLLIGCIFVCRKGIPESELASRTRALSLLNLAAVLLATVGGFSIVFAFVVSPQIRAYNRICVYIAFFSFCLLAMLLDEGRKKLATTATRRVFSVLFVGLLLVTGLLDQTSKAFVPRNETLKAEFENDSQFVKRIEALVPPYSMILQLPYDAFLPYFLVGRMFYYDHFRPYLHSKNLRWSYGAMHGRTADSWQDYVTNRPLDEIVDTASLAGFKGIYLDRYGYLDGGAEVEKELMKILGDRPIVSENNRFAFFNMTEFGEMMRACRNRSELFGPSGIKKLRPVGLSTTAGNLTYNLDVVKDRGDFVSVSGWVFVSGTSSNNSTIQLALKSGRNMYLLATRPMKRPDVTRLFGGQNYDDSGFSCIIAKEALDPGRYVLGIFVTKDGVERHQFTDRVITVVR